MRAAKVERERERRSGSRSRKIKNICIYLIEEIKESVNVRDS